jgi:glycosyltransferase involved in cell wall biosynthesis
LNIQLTKSVLFYLTTMLQEKTNVSLIQTSSKNQSIKVAWLLVSAGDYWQPLLSEFTKIFPKTEVFTCTWHGFIPGFENSFAVKQIGKYRVISTKSSAKGYGSSITYLSPSIIFPLLKIKPDVIFSTGFSIWTMLALVFKVIFRWRVIVIYEGSTPNVDHLNSPFRLVIRRLMTRYVDAFITNTKAGQDFLTTTLGAKEECVFARPYLIPHPKTYAHLQELSKLDNKQLQYPTFIFVGSVVPRKGVYELIQACSILKAKGYTNYSLLIVGDGSQRSELETFAKAQGLENQVHWTGWIKYEQVGYYFQKSDIYVFPTFEDTWGIVTVEAMLFSKPILCSRLAGSSEMVKEGENGYIFDPHNPEDLAEIMAKFIEQPQLIKVMGEKSYQIMSEHSIEKVADSLAKVVEFVF